MKSVISTEEVQIKFKAIYTPGVESSLVNSY